MVVHGNPARRFDQGDPRFRVEVLDDDVLLLDVQTSIVHRVPGGEVDRLLSGVLTYQTGHLPPGGAEAIRRALSEGSLQRRSVLVGGGALVASGILSTGLPFAAAAASLYPVPFDGATYVQGWNGQTDGGGWFVNGAWSGAASDLYINPGVTSLQVILHATSGDKDATGATIGSGHGAYIVATISGLAVDDDLRFYIQAGGEGGGAGTVRGGNGGIAVGVGVTGGTSANHWLLVAGAGGGDSGGAPGGRHGQDGGGERPGTGASGATGGTGGTNQVIEDPATNDLHLRGRDGYDALPSDTGTLTLPGLSGPPTRPGEGGVESSGRLGGGGGGAGWAGGGGGGGSAVAGTTANAGVTDGGGGGGGSSLIRTTALGGDKPGFVVSYSIYTVARKRIVNGNANVRFEAWS